MECSESFKAAFTYSASGALRLFVLILGLTILTYPRGVLAQVSCERFTAAECYRFHFSECVLELEGRGYRCRSPLDDCERNWKRTKTMNYGQLGASCERAGQCVFVPRGCLCPCDIPLPNEPKCVCECGGGAPATCRDEHYNNSR